MAPAIDANSTLGPLLRLQGVRLGELPTRSGSVDELAAYLQAILQEAVDFIDTVDDYGSIKPPPRPRAPGQSETGQQAAEAEPEQPAAPQGPGPQSSAEAKEDSQPVGGSDQPPPKRPTLLKRLKTQDLIKSPPKDKTKAGAEPLWRVMGIKSYSGRKATGGDTHFDVELLERTVPSDVLARVMEQKERLVKVAAPPQGPDASLLMDENRPPADGGVSNEGDSAPQAAASPAPEASSAPATATPSTPAPATAASSDPAPAASPAPAPAAAAAPAPKSDEKASQAKPAKKPDTEHWFCRRSLHENRAVAGSASWDEFVRYMKKAHAETEKAMTPTVVDTHEPIKWPNAQLVLPFDAATGTGGGLAGGRRWSDFTLSVHEMQHKVGRPVLDDRVFPVLQMTCQTVGPDAVPEILVASMTVRNCLPFFRKEERPRLVSQPNIVLGSYVSIERIRFVPGTEGAGAAGGAAAPGGPTGESGGADADNVVAEGSEAAANAAAPRRADTTAANSRIEWVMATASDAKGFLPMWVQTKAVPGQIAKDVPLFFKWLAAERGRTELTPRTVSRGSGGEPLPGYTAKPAEGEEAVDDPQRVDQQLAASEAGAGGDAAQDAQAAQAAQAAQGQGQGQRAQ